MVCEDFVKILVRMMILAVSMTVMLKTVKSKNNCVAVAMYLTDLDCYIIAFKSFRQKIHVKNVCDSSYKCF